MNFKYFIIAIYLGFVSLILLMVFKGCSQKVELETKDYYAKELRFQGEIDAMNNGAVYRDSFKVQTSGALLQISSPLSLGADSFRLEFMKPDDAASDRQFSFKGHTIPDMQVSGFAKGYYGLKIRAYGGGKSYLIEKNIKL